MVERSNTLTAEKATQHCQRSHCWEQDIPRYLCQVRCYQSSNYLIYARFQELFSESPLLTSIQYSQVLLAKEIALAGSRREWDSLPRYIQSIFIIVNFGKLSNCERKIVLISKKKLSGLSSCSTGEPVRLPRLFQLLWRRCNRGRRGRGV